jgi:hypothetical protein
MEIGWSHNRSIAITAVTFHRGWASGGSIFVRLQSTGALAIMFQNEECSAPGKLDHAIAACAGMFRLMCTGTSTTVQLYNIQRTTISQ